MPISDIASGLNFKRKGLLRILDEGMQGNIEEIVVAYKDRLCRFGFDLIERLLSKQGCRIHIVNPKKDTPEQELTDDLISIITVFSSKIYGLRKNRTSVLRNIREHPTENPEDTPPPNPGTTSLPKKRV